MTRTRRAFPLLATLAAALLLVGCVNPFQPAEPEPPSGEGVQENFGSIEELLRTIELAIATRPGGANAYIHAFADSTTPSQRGFRAFHDQGAKATWLIGSAGQPAPEPWTLPFERGVHTELSRIRPNDEYFFTFSPDPLSVRDEEIAENVFSIHRKYQLKSKSANADAVLIVSGFADLLIQKEGARFSIFEWRDRVDPDYGVNSVNVRSFTYERLESQ
jgi:hypothetical protein